MKEKGAYGARTLVGWGFGLGICPGALSNMEAEQTLNDGDRNLKWGEIS